MPIAERPAWGSDVPISMPMPADEAVLVPMFGFGMTQFRLVHDLSAAEYEALSVPVYAPSSGAGELIREDAAIDSGGSPYGA